MDNNIIELNVPARATENRASLSTESRRFQQIIASGALASTLFLVTLMNFSMSQDKVESSRGIASVSEQGVKTTEWDSGFLKRLASKRDRSIAATTGATTQIDKLRFGVLEGKYSLELNEGSVSRVEYQEAATEDRPVYLDSKESFLNEYGKTITPSFNSAVQKETQLQQGNIVERFEILNSDSKTVAEAVFTTDEFGRLLKLSVVENKR